MTRGQSGLLFLHCWRLSLFTLCRSPGALASVHKDLRLCDLCKELAFGHQCVNGSSRDSYNSLEFNVLCHQFLEREMLLRNVCKRVPEGRCDRSLARSAWERVPRKNRPVGYGMIGRS